MPQVFRRRSNAIAKGSILALVLLLLLAWATGWAIWWSPWMTRQDVPISQVVPFSHKHHFSGLGIDCRYCHVTVETSSFAGIPPTETCMTCHSQVWTEAPVLAPVRESWTTRQPLHWKRVHNLPKFVFFNHGIHVQKGIGCSTCHGPVQEMPLVWKAHTMWMRWCTSCHENPAPNLRPQSEIFNMTWQPPPDQSTRGPQLLAEYKINQEVLRDCSMCHR